MLDLLKIWYGSHFKPDFKGKKSKLYITSQISSHFLYYLKIFSANALTFSDASSALS